jgi:uncharacterized protein (DUF1499 family)
MIKFLLYTGIIIFIMYVSLFTYLSVITRKYPQPGMIDGKLKPCPGTPNCVCSEYENNPWYIQPLYFKGTTENAWSALKDAVTSSGGRIDQVTENYLWSTFRSRVFRFTDDVEFRLDAANKRIQVRSASRAGKGDLGVNRERIEKLRRNLTAGGVFK